VLKVKSNMDSGMFLGLQHAAIEALKSSKEWFASLNQEYIERRKAAHQILDALSCTYSKKQSGLFVWAKVPDGIADVEKWIDEILYGAKVFITPGFIFGETGKRFIRISLCSPVSIMKDAHKRIDSFVKSQSNVLLLNTKV